VGQGKVDNFLCIAAAVKLDSSRAEAVASKLGVRLDEPDAGDSLYLEQTSQLLFLININGSYLNKAIEIVGNVGIDWGELLAVSAFSERG
jgi:hypothetical protein